MMGFVSQKPRAAAIMIAISIAAVSTVPGHAAILEEVRAAGVVRCAVDLTPGFSAIDAQGRPSGFEVDFCRAIAAAAIGRAEAVDVRRVSTRQKFQALTDRELDVAFGQATWTFGREAALGVRFPVTVFYDGQGFLGWQEAGAALGDTRGRRVCVQGGTTTAANLVDVARQRQLGWQILEGPNSDEVRQLFLSRRCDLMTGDRAALAGFRQTLPMAGAMVLYPDIVSREPLGPAVLASDDKWVAVVRWAILATMIAEHRGSTAAVLAQVGAEADQELRNLAGREADFGRALGLAPTWARAVIDQVGTYAEIYERAFGTQGTVRIDRGINRLWTDGGLHYAPPLR